MLVLRIKECNGGTFVYNENHLYTGSIVHEYGEYSPEEVSVLGLLVKPGDTVIEGGSNIGLITVPLCKMVGENGVVVSFEAHPKTYQVLMANLHLNGCYVQCLDSCAALSDRYEVVNIDDYDDSVMRNVGGITTGHGSLSVGTDYIDAYFEWYNVSLIKLDIEGGELKALQGAVKTIEEYKPVLYVEDNDYDVGVGENNPVGRKSNSKELREFIVSMGYEIYSHQPQLTRSLPVVSHNLLCFHKCDKRKDEFFRKVAHDTL